MTKTRLLSSLFASLLFTLKVKPRLDVLTPSSSANVYEKKTFCEKQGNK